MSTFNGHLPAEFKPTQAMIDAHLRKKERRARQVANGRRLLAERKEAMR